MRSHRALELWLIACIASGMIAVSAAAETKVGSAAITARSLALAARDAPRARGGRCEATVQVPGQGASCRTADGLWLVPRLRGEPMLTHGPDLRASIEQRAIDDIGFGSSDSIVCSAPSRTRHVLLAYLLPSDYRAGGELVHGDRFAALAPGMRQGLLDAATVVDRRAAELARGARRRIRVACDSQGSPLVQRIVLPRTAAAYRDTSRSVAGFALIDRDLAAMGWLPRYPGYESARLPAVRRVLAYYDAEFVDGLAGQGTLYQRRALLDGSATDGQRVSASDPRVSRTARNVNNNPPQATLAVQYATGDEPPLFTSMLHELSHTLGAVQDDVPTSSLGGHCIDGIDVMCYDDGARRGGAYSGSVCAAAGSPPAPLEERFDCNADTYFHPAPAAGSPLSDVRVWHLGLAANETFAPFVEARVGRPAAVEQVTATVRGTQVALRWPAVEPALRRTYDVALHVGDGPWQHVPASQALAMPRLFRPYSTYTVEVGAVDARLATGPRAQVIVRTGADTTPPDPPSRVVVVATSRTKVRLQFALSSDNVRAMSYGVERRAGVGWVAVGVIRAPVTASSAGGDLVTTPPLGPFAPGARFDLRLRARDANGNTSTPSRVVSATTRR